MARHVQFTAYDTKGRGVAVRARYSPPTRDYYDRGTGAWMPGEAAEIAIVSAIPIDEGADVAEVEADVEGLEESARLQADDDAHDGPDTRAEARGER